MIDWESFFLGFMACAFSLFILALIVMALTDKSNGMPMAPVPPYSWRDAKPVDPRKRKREKRCVNG